jgi:cytoskeletal protein RodZ
MDMGIVVLFIVLVLSGVIIWRVSKSWPPQDIPATTRSDASVVPRRLTVHNSMSVSATARAKASTQFVDGTAPLNGATAPSPFTETLRRLPAWGG